MLVRPHIHHIVGFSKSLIPNFDNWLECFNNQYSEQSFVSLTKDIFREIEPEDVFYEEYLKRFSDVMVSDLIPNFSSEIDIFGMYPIERYEVADLYNHDILWAMIEAGIIESKSYYTKIPYQDFSGHIGKSKSELISSIQDILMVKNLLNYKGHWGRKYPNHPIFEFDNDLTFALKFFQKLNLNIQGKDINRYIVFEMN